MVGVVGCCCCCYFQTVCSSVFVIVFACVRAFDIRFYFWMKFNHKHSLQQEYEVSHINTSIILILFKYFTTITLWVMIYVLTWHIHIHMCTICICYIYGNWVHFNANKSRKSKKKRIAASMYEHSVDISAILYTVNWSMDKVPVCVWVCTILANNFRKYVNL